MKNRIAETVAVVTEVADMTDASAKRGVTEAKLDKAASQTEEIVRADWAAAPRHLLPQHFIVE